MNKVIAFEMQQAVKGICTEGVGAPDVAVVTFILTFLWYQSAEEGVDSYTLFSCLKLLNSDSELKGDSIIVELFTTLPDEALGQVKTALCLTTLDKLSCLFHIFDNLEYRLEASEDFFELAVEVVLELNASYVRRQPSTNLVRDFIWEVLDPKCNEVVTDLGGVLADLFKNPALEKRDLQYLKPQNWFEHMVSMLTAKYYSLEGRVDEIEIINWPKQKFDVVLANPVFEGSVKNTPYEVLNDYSDFRHKNLLPLFIDIILRSLSKNGRAVIVVPEGFLTSISDRKFRALLLDKYCLQAVVQLPEGSLSPAKKVAGSLLYFNKMLQEKSIRFVDLKSTSFIQDNFKSILEIILTSKEGSNLSFFDDISLEDIYAKDCDLTPRRYVKAQVQREISSKVILNRILELEDELKNCDFHIELLLEELGEISV